MLRSWGLITLTGTAQPWFGDVTTAAVALAQGNGVIAVTVAATTRYRVGDRIYIDPGLPTQDILLIQRIFSGTVLYCASEGNAKTNVHIAGAIIQLTISASQIMLQPLASNAATVFIGSDSTVTNAGAGSACWALPPAAAMSPNFSVGYNIVRTSDGWMAGAANDKMIVSAIVS